MMVQRAALALSQEHMVATLSAMEHAVTGGEVNGPKKERTAARPQQLHGWLGASDLGCPFEGP